MKIKDSKELIKKMRRVKDSEPGVPEVKRLLKILLKKK